MVGGYTMRPLRLRTLAKTKTVKSVRAKAASMKPFTC
jgi:hypothetical protein